MNWELIVLTLEVIFIILGLMSLIFKNWGEYRNAKGIKAKEEVKREWIKEIIIGIIVAIALVTLTILLFNFVF